jgi:hypothetical protein
MEPTAEIKARIAALHKEMDSIHYANKVYWKCDHPIAPARAEHALRQERLEEVRVELFRLQSTL